MPWLFTDVLVYWVARSEREPFGDLATCISTLQCSRLFFVLLCSNCPATVFCSAIALLAVASGFLWRATALPVSVGLGRCTFSPKGQVLSQYRREHGYLVTRDVCMTLPCQRLLPLGRRAHPPARPVARGHGPAVGWDILVYDSYGFCHSLHRALLFLSAALGLIFSLCFMAIHFGMDAVWRCVR